jgi:hypothetical protein
LKNKVILIGAAAENKMSKGFLLKKLYPLVLFIKVVGVSDKLEPHIKYLRT